MEYITLLLAHRICSTALLYGFRAHPEGVGKLGVHDFAMPDVYAARERRVLPDRPVNSVEAYFVQVRKRRVEECVTGRTRRELKDRRHAVVNYVLFHKGWIAMSRRAAGFHAASLIDGEIDDE